MSLLACVHTTRVANSHVDSVTPFRRIILPCQQSPYLVNIQLRRLLHRGIHPESRGLQLTSTTSLHNQCRSKGNISGGARKCWRREPLGGSGGVSHKGYLGACSPRKIWNLETWKCYFQRSARAICDLQIFTSLNQWFICRGKSNDRSHAIISCFYTPDPRRRSTLQCVVFVLDEKNDIEYSLKQSLKTI